MDGDQYTIDDICARKHKNNRESREANPSAEVKKEAHKKILYWLADSLYGYTSKELAGLLGKPLNAISGRLSELKDKQLIEPTGERREGCAVLRIKK